VFRVTNSILNDIKKVLGLDPSNTSFDTDVIIHINSTFADLSDIGIGPSGGFMIADNSVTWDAFIGTTNLSLNRVKTYISLKVRMIFDPPQTSFVIDAYNKLIEEAFWRMSVREEATGWTDPNPPSTSVSMPPC
jgi:hypothetical protein